MMACGRSARALPFLLLVLLSIVCGQRPAPSGPARPELVLQDGSPGQVWALAFSPDGKSLASGSYHTALNLWDANTGRLRRELTGHNGRVEAVAFSPDGRTLASGSTDTSAEGDVRLWDAASGRLRRSILAHLIGVTAVGFSPDGRSLASAGYFVRETDEGAFTCAEAAFWQVGTGRRLRALRSFGDATGVVAFSPGLGTAAVGRVVGDAAQASETALWDLNTGRRRWAASGRMDTAAFSADGRYLAVGSGDSGARQGEVRLHDARTGQSHRSVSERGHWVRAIAFSPDGRVLASGGGAGTTILWDAATGKKLRALAGQKGTVRAIAFSPDGRRVATGSGDWFEEGGDWGEVKVWRVADGRLLATLLTLRDRQGEQPGKPIAWIAYTPEGYYDGSPGVEGLIRWRVNGKLLPGKALAKEHRRRLRLE